MSKYQNLIKVVLSCSLMAVFAFALLSPRMSSVAYPPIQSGSAPTDENSLPLEGQIIHAHYRLTRNISDSSGQAAGWGTANQTTETWWLVAPNQTIAKIFNRVTDDDGILISEILFDGSGKMYQYWNQRDELWIDTDSSNHVIATWSPDVIDRELIAKGFIATVQTQIAGHQTLVMELRTNEPLPAEWLPQIPQTFREASLVRRVFVGQVPIKGLQVGYEDVLKNLASAEFVIQSYRLVSWEVLDSSQFGNVFAWQPPLAKTVKDSTKPK